MPLRILRFCCVFIIYYSTNNDWVSVSNAIVYLYKRWNDLKYYPKFLIIFYLIAIRIAVIIFCEVISILIILTTDVSGSGGPLSLLQNFAFLVIVLELDDIVMTSFVVGD